MAASGSKNSSNSFIFLLIIYSLISLLPWFTHSLSTLSISETANQTLICASIHPTLQQPFLNCTSFPTGIRIPLNRSASSSLSGIVSGDGFMCGLWSTNTSILRCWRFSVNGTSMSHKRIYHGQALKQLVAGNSSICGLVEGTNRLQCWQWDGFNSSPISRQNHNFSSISVGEDFVCGVSQAGKVTCLGSNNNSVVGKEPTSKIYSVVSAGFNHACAISSEDSSLDCWGEMKGEKPQGKFTSLALGENRSCGLRPNGIVVCWGESNFSLPQSLQHTYFITIEAKRSVFCAVSSSNFTLYCWGNPIFDVSSNNFMVFKSDVKPGQCRRECPCSSPLPGYGRFCEEGYQVCQPCEYAGATALEPSPQLPSSSSDNKWSKNMVAFLVVGCVGSLSLVLVCGFFVFKFCKIRGCRIHDSGRLDLDDNQGRPAVVLERRLSHLVSMGANTASLEEFSLQVLLEATSNFSEEHKIGTGSYGSVYYATLDDGRQVAIKRAETSTAFNSSSIGGINGGVGIGQTRRQEDKDSAFVNELESLSRLNHKNLVRLIGFFEDSKERILVYEYMNNGSLHDHLHNINSRGKRPSFSSWAARIKVALDAARGIEYLHVYSVPPIIHRDIKSSNILLDDTWNAKVSDFGLSLMGPEDAHSHLSLGAAGTFGYMDPEYYRLQRLTTKSDVYSFGVVLLELLSGYHAIHKNEHGVPRNVVDFLVPYIIDDEIHRILDPNVAPPTPYEIEAVKYVGYLAADCVKLQGRDRPSMTEIVTNLDRAFNYLLDVDGPLSRSPSTTESSSTQ